MADGAATGLGQTRPPKSAPESTADNPAARGEAATPRPFSDPAITADGARRASVAFDHLDTLWVNTGTLCNLACANCYIESTPTNDRLVYITSAELKPFLDEAEAMGAREIGFTGGEPFMNPDMAAMTEDALGRGFSVLILTNAMKPMMRPRVRDALIAIQARYGDKLRLRVSLDHYTADIHDEERGEGAFAKALLGLDWLAANGFAISVAGRYLAADDEATARAGFAALFAERGLPIDAQCGDALTLFPEMDAEAKTPEITEACWDILGLTPNAMMCATSRMLVKRKGAARPAVLACTLLAYDDAFELGETLAEARKPVSLNHPHCSRFCVLGGASCSG